MQTAHIHLISADSREVTGAGTPADALGVPKRMSTSNPQRVEFGDSDHRDEDVLRELYLGRGLTTAEVGDVLDVAQCTVSKWLRRHDIETKTAGEVCSDGDTDKLRDEAWLRQQYVNARKSMSTIADEIDVSQPTVNRWLRRHDIPIRRPEETYTAGDFDKLRDEDWLREQYVEEHRSAADIARTVGVVETTVRKWLRRHDIDVRRSGVPGGEHHPSWKGGVENYYGPDWRSQRRKALERDGHRCVVCGTGQNVEVHHIRPFRKFGVENYEKANALGNLVCLCRQHHMKWEGVPLRPEVVGDG